MVVAGTPILAITGFFTIAFGLLVLLAGYILGKRRDTNNHKKVMIGAVITLAAFLIQYIIRASMGDETRFQGPDNIKYFIYIPILVVHITFAIICIGLISVHLTRSLKQEEVTNTGRVIFPKDYRSSHRAMGRITLLLWSFSYLGGIIIFIMLYVMQF